MIRQGPQRKSFGHHASAVVELGGRPNYEPSRGPRSSRGDVIFLFPLQSTRSHCTVLCSS